MLGQGHFVSVYLRTSAHGGTLHACTVHATGPGRYRHLVLKEVFCSVPNVGAASSHPFVSVVCLT